MTDTCPYLLKCNDHHLIKDPESLHVAVVLVICSQSECHHHTELLKVDHPVTYYRGKYETVIFVVHALLHNNYTIVCYNKGL